jgi:hypothetical protein
MGIRASAMQRLQPLVVENPILAGGQKQTCDMLQSAKDIKSRSCISLPASEKITSPDFMI